MDLKMARIAPSSLSHHVHPSTLVIAATGIIQNDAGLAIVVFLVGHGRLDYDGTGMPIRCDASFYQPGGLFVFLVDLCVRASTPKNRSTRFLLCRHIDSIAHYY
jgi:hypothetical protein